MMSKLSKLYAMLANARELGVDLGVDVYKQTDRLEEEIIKKEIITVIKDQIEPTLRHIKRNLTLIVYYVTDEGVRVRLSRDAGKMQDESLIDLTPDPQAEHGTRRGGKNIKRSPKSAIRVIKRDGSIIHESTAASTLVAAVVSADPIKVRELGIICCKVPLVSTTKDSKYGSTQVEVAPGLYVITHSNNKLKKAFLEEMSMRLKLGWTIELLK